MIKHILNKVKSILISFIKNNWKLILIIILFGGLIATIQYYHSQYKKIIRETYYKEIENNNNKITEIENKIDSLIDSNNKLKEKQIIINKNINSIYKDIKNNQNQTDAEIKNILRDKNNTKKNIEYINSIYK